MADDPLVEEREDVMHPPSSGNPTLRIAHFLKPIFDEHHKDLPPPPCSLISSKPTFEKIKKYHIRSYKMNPSVKWKIWVDNLKPRYQEIWKKAGIYEAILASTRTFAKDTDLIIGLAERWCVETNTFILPWGEVSITLEDVVFLGNFSVLGDSFSTPLAHEYVHILNCLKNAYRRCGRNPNGVVTSSVWMEYFMGGGGNQLEHEAFLAMWLSRFVLICAFDRIAVRNLHVAIHLSRGNRIALAPYVLASIYRDMGLIHKSIVESAVNFRFRICHGDLVHMWAWERFPTLRPAPSVIERGEPRSARWDGVKISKVKDVRAALDSAKESFMWRPYSITSSNCVLSKLYRDDEQWVVVDSDDAESFARCLKVSELVGFGYIEQYLPHRVAMQFGYDQDVPPCVIRSNQSPETAWRSYNRPVRGTKLYIPPRCFESDISSRYMVWWRGFVAVSEETLTSRVQNENHSPLGPCRHKSDVTSLATPGCAEERSEDCSEEDNIPIAQLMRGSKRKRFDLDNEPVETPTNSICRTEHVELRVQSMSLSGKCKNSKSPAQRKEAVVSKSHYYTEVNPVNLKDCTASEVARVELKTLDAPGCPLEFVKGRQEDIVEEDSLTITQLLIRSENKGCFMKTGVGGGDEELVLLTTDSKKVALVSRSWKCANESMELTKQSMGNPIDLEEDAVVGKDNHHEVKNNNIALANGVVSKASCPEYNNVKTEEESSDNTTAELPELGLEARIRRLEKIVDLIKAKQKKK